MSMRETDGLNLTRVSSKSRIPTGGSESFPIDSSKTLSVTLRAR